MPLHFICNHCRGTIEIENTTPCAQCDRVICTNCIASHIVISHPRPQEETEPIINQNHIHCTVCTTEGFRSDMMECLQEGALLCNETCFNKHLDEAHQMKGAALAPGVFKEGGRLDITYRRPIPPLPKARTEEEINKREGICNTGECRQESAAQCPECEFDTCDDHWAGECEYCRTDMCTGCYEDHECPNRSRCQICESTTHVEEIHYCDYCENSMCESCYDDHDCENRGTCEECEEHYHTELDRAKTCDVCMVGLCSQECLNDHNSNPNNGHPPEEITPRPTENIGLNEATSVAHAQTDVSPAPITAEASQSVSDTLRDRVNRARAEAGQGPLPTQPAVRNCESCGRIYHPVPYQEHSIDGTPVNVCSDSCFFILRARIEMEIIQRNTNITIDENQPINPSTPAV